MSGSPDLIAYLDERRHARTRAGVYTLAGIAILLLAVLAVTAFLHAAGVGQHTHTTIAITAHGYHVILTHVGGVPVLP